MPVTTYLDRRDPKLALHPTKLDFDFTSLPVLFELLSRAQVQGLPAAVLLAHSWSFVKSCTSNRIGKVIHFAPSQEAQDKLSWITEFCTESRFLRFATCASFSKESASQKPWTDRFEGLIEIDGDPSRVSNASAATLTNESHPWLAMHPALNVSHPTPSTIMASWQSFQESDALYIELLGGDFFEAPPQQLRAPVQLKDARVILLSFRHEANGQVGLLVFFMQYAERDRVRNDSQTVTASADPHFETLAFQREPNAATFKIAIKLLPHARSPGWVQLDGFRLQRRG
jgi:hypothetical protein